MTKKELIMLQNLPLELKIEKTKQRIREWVARFRKDGVYVSFSGGKDSTVLLDIARTVYPDLKAVFCDTGLEYPELKEFVNTINNVEIIRPKKDFRTVIEDYGYPVISKNTARKIRDLQNPTRNNETTRRMRLTGVMGNGKKTMMGKLANKWVNKFFNIRDKKYLEYKDKANFKVSEQCCNIMKKKTI